MVNILQNDYIGKLILQSNKDCCSENFVDNVMIGCYKYEIRKNRIKNLKKYFLFALPIILMILFMFIPCLNNLIFLLFNKITLIGILKYYLLSATTIIISFYVLLIERIFKLVKLRLQQIN